MGFVFGRQGLSVLLWNGFEMQLKYIFFLLLLSPFLTACSLPGAGPSRVVLTYWGLFESLEVFKPVINDYGEQRPNVTVDYSQRSYANLAQYKETILNRLKEGKAGDILRVHATWVKDLLPYLYPIPEKILKKEEFNQIFYPAAREALTFNGQIYGLPLEYDGLMLLANQKLLDADKVLFPKTWEEFRDAAVKLTKTTGDTKKITQAGAAMGLSVNVPHAADVFSFMLLQSGLAVPKDLASKDAVATLAFLSNFYRGDKVWSESLPSSLISFARGQTAFIFAPTWRILEIKNLNPSLAVTVGNPPQFPKGEGFDVSEVYLASFWVEVVPKASKFKDTAYDFLKFAIQAEELKKMYAVAASGRLFGEPYPRRDLATSLAGNEYLGPLLAVAPKARLAPTVDASGNDPVVDIINKAIADAAAGSDLQVTLESAKANLEKILGR